jgi:hypothetical protein
VLKVLKAEKLQGCGAPAAAAVLALLDPGP